MAGETLNRVDLMLGTLAAIGYGYFRDSLNEDKCGFSDTPRPRTTAQPCGSATTHFIVFRNGGWVQACERHAQEVAFHGGTFLLSIEAIDGAVPSDVEAAPNVAIGDVPDSPRLATYRPSPDRFPDNPFVPILHEAFASRSSRQVTVPGRHVDEFSGALQDAIGKLIEGGVGHDDLEPVIVYRYIDGHGRLHETTDVTRVPPDDDPVVVRFAIVEPHRGDNYYA